MNKEVTKQMYSVMGIDSKVYDFAQEIAESLEERFDEIDKVAEYNQLKVVHAMQNAEQVKHVFMHPADMGITM